MERDLIKNQAKEIMDNFMDSLKNIQVEDEFVLFRTNCFREEGEGEIVDEDFKQRFLSNAREVRGNAIIANKGFWVE